MTPRRAMTLVEVLAATALLALMTSVCVPLMRESMRALRPTDMVVDVGELGALADAYLAAPETFGVEDVGGDGGPDDASSIGWPDAPDRPEVAIARLEGPADEDPGAKETAADLPHVWLAFTCADVTVWRWVALDAEEEREDAGTAPEGVER